MLFIFIKVYNKDKSIIEGVKYGFSQSRRYEEIGCLVKYVN